MLSILPILYLHISIAFMRMLLTQWIAVAILYIHKMAQNVRCLDTQMRVLCVTVTSKENVFKVVIAVYCQSSVPQIA